MLTAYVRDRKFADILNTFNLQERVKGLYYHNPSLNIYIQVEDYDDVAYELHIYCGEQVLPHMEYHLRGHFINEHL